MHERLLKMVISGCYDESQRLETNGFEFEKSVFLYREVSISEAAENFRMTHSA
jgi:hypothetical protein